MALRTLSCVLMMLSVVSPPRAAQQAAPEPGITGQVLAVDGGWSVTDGSAP